MATKQPSQLTVATTMGESDIAVIQQSGVVKSATRAVLLANVTRDTDQFAFEMPIASPANGTVLVIDNNRVVGTITGADMRMVAGSCTATLQIADEDGSNATNVNGCISVSVTTTNNDRTATANNTMAITGSTDRKLLLVLTSVSGAGPFRLGIIYTRA